MGPIEIARGLAMVADETWQIGDRGPGGAIRRNNGWAVRVRSDGSSPGECLDQLLDRLAPREADVNSLAREPSTTVRVWLYVSEQESNLTLMLASDQVARIAKLGAEFALDLYSSAHHRWQTFGPPAGEPLG
jgi:hypothetical protein